MISFANRQSLYIIQDAFSDPKMRRLFKKGMKCNTDATRGMERLTKAKADGPTNIREARDVVRGANAKRKAGASNKSTTSKSDRTPSNDTFLHNKSSNHRGYRNDLIEFTPTPEKKKEKVMSNVDARAHPQASNQEILQSNRHTSHSQDHGHGSRAGVQAR